jgi:hypothetical protein
MKTEKYEAYHLVIQQTAVTTNTIEIEVKKGEDPGAKFQDWLESNYWGWYDEASWGEAFYYQVGKAPPSHNKFEVIDVDLIEEFEG